VITSVTDPRRDSLISSPGRVYQPGAPVLTDPPAFTDEVGAPKSDALEAAEDAGASGVSASLLVSDDLGTCEVTHQDQIHPVLSATALIHQY
jgi:hypothetical protein